MISVTFSPLAVGGSRRGRAVLNAGSELAGVAVEACVHGSSLLRRDAPWRGRPRQRQVVVPRHRVKSFGKICGAFEDHLLGELFWVSWMPGYKLPEPVEAVVDAWLGQRWNSKYHTFMIIFITPKKIQSCRFLKVETSLCSLALFVAAKF